ncbi:MAG: hypothetical protein HYX65_01250 [Gemmatimonadetes bacterium]|nr:hypothetical protein [Gemmatimonadota bacterium]
MSGFLAWLPDTPRADSRAVASAMAAALRVHEGQGMAWWLADELCVGLLASGSSGDVARQLAPAVSGDGQRLLWLAGEVYASSNPAPGVNARSSTSLDFRRRLLLALDAAAATSLGAADAIIGALDGEFVALLWDRRSHTLTLWTDRLGSLPAFWSRGHAGTAMASGVRGVLAAPAVGADPDLEALREAVSYGGYRLGARTNVRGVSFVGDARRLRVMPAAPARLTRWWHWRDIKPVRPASLADAVAELQGHWVRAVASRLDGADRPGQTLSGGLDSRAILAEAAPRARSWRALTYGVPRCDDVRFASQAALAAGVTLDVHALYHGGDPGWLDARLAHVQETDGLLDLGDLMHAEALPWMRRHLDAIVSGYIGDVIVGPTYGTIETPADVLAALPWYGGILGEPHAAALARAAAMIGALDGAPPRFTLLEDKRPQSTNLAHGALYRPYVLVRRPFIAHAFLDFCQGLDPAWRTSRGLQGAWLRTHYPLLFAHIPHQKTGVAANAPRWRWHVARGTRVSARMASRALRALGLPVAPRVRGFTDDATHWRAHHARARIGALLRAPDAAHRAAFPAGAVEQVLDDWERAGAAPAQVIGALAVFEHYHRGLGTHLAAARRAEPLAPAPLTVAP